MTDATRTEDQCVKRPLHPFCNACGWRKGGLDSWDGRRCRCGHYEPPIATFDVPATVTELRP